MTDDKPRIEINWVQAAAGALAAVTSAVLLSTVGVAGTIIGAALGSLVLTTGNAVYSHYLGVTKERVAKAQLAAAVGIGLARTRVRDASADVASDGPSPEPAELADELAAADDQLDRAQEVLEQADPEDASPGWRTVLAGLPWKRVLLVSTGIFIAAMAMILAFELVAGRAVSSYTGGSDPDRRTSIPGLGSGTATDSDDATPDDAPADPAEQPDEEPLVPEDPAEPTTTEETVPAEPTPTPTPEAEPTAEPTPEPTTEATPEEEPVPTP